MLTAVVGPVSPASKVVKRIALFFTTTIVKLISNKYENNVIWCFHMIFILFHSIFFHFGPRTQVWSQNFTLLSYLSSHHFHMIFSCPHYLRLFVTFPVIFCPRRVRLFLFETTAHIYKNSAHSNPRDSQGVSRGALSSSARTFRSLYASLASLAGPVRVAETDPKGVQKPPPPCPAWDANSPCSGHSGV